MAYVPGEPLWEQKDRPCGPFGVGSPVVLNAVRDIHAPGRAVAKGLAKGLATAEKFPVLSPPWAVSLKTLVQNLVWVAFV